MKSSDLLSVMGIGTDIERISNASMLLTRFYNDDDDDDDDDEVYTNNFVCFFLLMTIIFWKLDYHKLRLF